MTNDLKRRLAKLEASPRLRPMNGLSFERRRLLTDRAVRDGDQEALAELERYRVVSLMTAGHAAVVTTAGLRADQ